MSPAHARACLCHTCAGTHAMPGSHELGLFCASVGSNDHVTNLACPCLISLDLWIVWNSFGSLWAMLRNLDFENFYGSIFGHDTKLSLQSTILNTFIYNVFNDFLSLSRFIKQFSQEREGRLHHTVSLPAIFEFYTAGLSAE